MAKKRTFKKLREHLTSTELDEKATVLENISRMPTNNTAFVFGADPSNPQGNSFETIIDGETDETDYNVGESPTSYTEARDTSGLFNAGGNHAAGEYVKTVEPPGDTSYILGPMAAMYYTWSYPWTMIGYIRESDRKMVNLARIDGKLSDWDQSSGFSSYGQLTLDQAKWFFNIQKAFGNSNDPDTYSYRAYYPGPPSQTADAYGRYPCILTGVSKQKPNSHPNATPLDKQSGDNYSAMQAQADKGSGFISFKPDLNWYKKNKKKPKGAPSDWNNMSDDEKANWISQNQPEERFDYQGGRFRPNQNNAQDNRVVNPFSIFDPSQDPLGDIPISQQFNVDSPLGTNNQGTFDKDGNYIPPGFENAIGTDQINQPLGDTQGKFMPSNPNFRGAGNNKNYNPKEPNGPVSNNLINTFTQSGRKFGDYVSDKIEKSIDTALEYLSKPMPTRPKTGQGGRPLGDTTVRGGEGVNSSGRYNLNLATLLPISIVSGQSLEIPVSKSGGRSMVNSITSESQLNALNNALTIDKSTPTDAENTINPVGKTDQVLGNGWQVQGGSTFNFNTKTNELEIVSNKTLRSTSGGESVTRDATGKITRFTDIPDLDIEKAKSITDKALANPFVDKFLTGLSNLVKPKPIYTDRRTGTTTGEELQIYDPNSPNYGKTYSNAWDLMKDNKDSTMYTDFRDNIANLSKKGAENTVQGTGSNAYAIRNFLQNLEVKSSIDSKGWKPFAQNSDIENIGGGKGHVYSNVKVPFNELPPKVQEIIRSKHNVKESISLERKREIFGHLTQPVVLPETKQKTYKVSPGQRYRDKNKKPEKTNFQDMDKLFNKNIGGPQPFKPQERTSWTKDFINQNVIKSQEKMNNVLELIGDGKFALDHAMNDYKKMGAKELEQYWGKNPNMYSFLFNGKKYNVTRKEHVEGDSVVFMEDQQGVKSNMLQSELNEKLEEQNEKWIKEAYFKSHPVIPEKKESTYELIKRRFLENKKIAPEFPAEPPPEMVNGYHPKFGKRAARYKKLDPASANAMPLTGDPETDEIVRKQKTVNKIKSMKKK